jgi:hypothetical protein
MQNENINNKPFNNVTPSLSQTKTARNPETLRTQQTVFVLHKKKKKKQHRFFVVRHNTKIILFVTIQPVNNFTYQSMNIDIFRDLNENLPARRCRHLFRRQISLLSR